MRLYNAALWIAALLPRWVGAVSPTDQYQDADTAQSGYLPNHNVDPSKLSQYVHAWSATFNAQEKFSAKPITYTPAGFSHELVVVASQQNIVRVLDSITGAILYTRTLDPPFQSVDSNCGDISPTIGITGTPIIDPATDIMYFFSKGYKGGATGSGTLMGQYKFYAVQLPSLANVAGYPIIIDGNYANNDNTRYFVGGTLLNRPGLAMIGNSIVAGFGGHCDNFNYTGMLVTVSKTTATVQNIQAMVAAPGAPSPQPTSYLMQTGGKAGIWHAGMGLAVRDNNVFFATGNAVGPGINKVQGKSASGNVYSSTLEQVVANFAVDPVTGNLTQADYFEPYNFDTVLNGGDNDMGSSGVALLDRNTFKAPGVGVAGIAVAAGKDGIVYVMNADNLGGFYNGANGIQDATLQQIVLTPSKFYGGVGSYPGEGGYLYFCPTGGPLYAYSYALDRSGNPLFTLAGQGGTGLACTGNPTVTSLNGQPGTGVVWLADTNQGVIAFNAVPVNNVLTPITLGWASGRLNKYQRPVFGNARIYTTENNILHAIVGPVGTASSVSSMATPTSSTSQLPVSLPVSSTVPTSSSVLSSTSSTLSSSSSSSSVSVPSPPNSSSSIISTSSSSSSSISSPPSSVPVSGPPSSSSLIIPTSSSSSSSIPPPLSSSTLSSSSTTSPSTSPSSSLITSIPSPLSTTSSSTTPFTSPTSVSGVIPYPTTGLNPAEPSSISTFNYIGCYTDLPDGITRTLASNKFVYDPMNLSSCAQNCTNYDFFGTEYGRECYCGYTLNATLRATESTCNTPCSGNSSQICGSASRLSVYQNNRYIAPPPGPSHVQVVGNYGWIGCFTEATGVRALSSKSFTNSSMTSEQCVTFCSGFGYAYAGVEYGTQCYCGNTINTAQGSVLTTTSSCSMLCGGSKLEYCGAGSRLDVYQQGAVPTTSSSVVISSMTSSVISSTVSPVSSSSSNPLSSSSSIPLSSSTSTLSSASTTPLSSTPSTLSSPPTTTLFQTTSPIPTTSTSIPTSSTLTSTSSSTTTSSIPKGTLTNPGPQRRTFNWNIGWVSASPDGFTRPFVGINGQWPLPPIIANIGDTIVINVVNGLGNQSTSVHFHGLFNVNSTFEDGSAMVAQCPIAPGGSFVYQFLLQQSGTYWYHAHVGGQYIDGFRGPVTIRDTRDLNNYGNIPVANELILSLTDVYHVEAPFLINYFLSANNTSGAEPVPDSALINESQNAKFTMVPGQTYLFHIINMGALAGQYLQFEGHNMTIIEADGVYTQSYTVSQLFVAVAQRYSVLVTAKSDAGRNFAVVSQFLTDMFDQSVTPAGQNPTCTAYLVYNAAATLPAPFTLTPQPFSDTVLVPYDQAPMLDSDNVQYIYLTVDFIQNSWGSTRAAINGQTYLPQKVPTFFTALTAPSQYATNPTIYGQVNAQILPFNSIIELNLNNHDSRAHPFHLHGHAFQIISRGGNEPFWPGLYSPPPAPMRRDTVVVYPGVSVTIRFKADNPGVWLFHCHTEFHVEAGMTTTFIEGVDEMVRRKPYLPNSHKLACDSQSIPRTGNAGGNSKSWLDLSGAVIESDPGYFGAMVKGPSVNPYQGGQP